MAEDTTGTRRTPAPVPRLRVGLMVKILLATLLAAALPLFFISYSALQSSHDASVKATKVATEGLDQQALTTLELQAISVAKQESELLTGAAQDTLSASALLRSPEAYLTFYQAHTGQIWHPGGTRKAPTEVRQTIPLYRELAYIDAKGQERVVIREGQVVGRVSRHNVSNPANTVYRHETYFPDTRILPKGQLYVSRLTAWYATNPSQPAAHLGAAAPDGAWLGSYVGIVRFATPVFDPQGRFDGIVELAFDARHLIDRSMHTIPGTIRQVVWPDYASANYIFMWDDQGWLIAHPLLSRLRGLNATGTILSPWQQGMSAADKARFPFNMYLSSFSTDAPIEYRNTLQGIVGYRTSYNARGLLKTNVYAPISFSQGIYKVHGVFGGLVLGASLSDFHSAANRTHDAIAAEAVRLEERSREIALAAFVFLVVLASLVALSITRPLIHLTAAARAMGRGELDTSTLDRMQNQWVADEVSELARVFRRMAEQVYQRETKLKQEVAELHIQIDQQKQETQVEEIAGTEWFQYLTANAQSMRSRFKTPEVDETAGVAPDG